MIAAAHRLATLAAILAIGVAARAGPDEIGTLMTRGGEAMRASDAQGAADAFGEAARAGAEIADQAARRRTVARALFNQGLALAKAGRFSEAEEAFLGADLQSAAASERAAALYNAGHCRFTRGLAQAETDPAGAIEILRAGAAAFGAAARADTGDREAARALEITRRHIKRLSDRLEEERKSEEQKQQQAADAAEQLRDLAQRQEDLAEKSGRASRSGDPPDPEEMRRLRDEQAALNEDTERSLEDLGAAASPDAPASEAAERVREAVGRQKEASGHLGRSEAGAARPMQEEAAERLRAAAAAMDEAAKPDGEDSPESESEREQESGKGQPPKEPAEPMSEAGTNKQDSLVAQLLEKERREREAREARERRRRPGAGGITPVDKDW